MNMFIKISDEDENRVLCDRSAPSHCMKAHALWSEKQRNLNGDNSKLLLNQARPCRLCPIGTQKLIK